MLANDSLDEMVAVDSGEQSQVASFARDMSSSKMSYEWYVVVRRESRLESNGSL